VAFSGPKGKLCAQCIQDGKELSQLSNQRVTRVLSLDSVRPRPSSFFTVCSSQAPLRSPRFCTQDDSTSGQTRRNSDSTALSMTNPKQGSLKRTRQALSPSKRARNSYSTAPTDYWLVMLNECVLNTSFSLLLSWFMCE
jgi:hypothetical protein